MNNAEVTNNKKDENSIKDSTMAENENPRANENIRVRTEDPEPSEEATDDVGSEITDGEAG